MMQEVDRCQQAVDLAVEGHQVVVVSLVTPAYTAWQVLCWNLLTKCQQKTSFRRHRTWSLVL